MSTYLPAVTRADVVHDRVVRLVFDDGTEGDVDLGPKIWGPVFERLRADDELFARMYVDAGTIMWPGDLDLAPEPLYEEIHAGSRGRTVPGR